MYISLDVIIIFHIQYLIPTNRCPIYSGLPRRVLNLLEVSITNCVSLKVIVFNHELLPS